MFLYEKREVWEEVDALKTCPPCVTNNLSPARALRPYQTEAFENFVTYFEKKKRPHPLQVLFHMATGSGKTLMMAGLMLYLYQQGYRNFLFFVNLSNIVEKTKVNFLDRTSSKYLFADEIVIDGEHVAIQEVTNFQYSDPRKINLYFTTTQGLHQDIWFAKENAMTLDDFEAYKVVLISDEAHHLNVDTKKKVSKAEEENRHSWEHTVKTIFERNSENVLLEFTATCDLENPSIKAAYTNRIIYNYPLTNFYRDRYSKDIITFRSNLSTMDRALQALILSQYRLKLFEKHHKSIRPLVLFKAAKIAESKTFEATFQSRLQALVGADIEHIVASSEQPIMKKAKAYFEAQQISYDALASELKEDFSERHCVSVNSKDDLGEKQLLLNSLEDASNPYRAIFEVEKLDEGWDVLNLFDIVRLYETRQSGGKKISPATIREAQLIGRGARYCPFRLNEEQPVYQRKYDDDVENEMRVCETLYYHCQNEHRYVTELKQALREIGLDTDHYIERQYILKDTFVADDFYQKGIIFLNDRELEGREGIHELLPTVRDSFYEYREPTQSSGSDLVLREDGEASTSIDYVAEQLHMTKMSIADIADTSYAIVYKALRKFPVFEYRHIHELFPHVDSIRSFITKPEYLGGVTISVHSIAQTPGAQVLYDAVCYVLGKISGKLDTTVETYKGTSEFHPKKISDVFRNKTVKYTEMHDGGLGYSQNDPSVQEDQRIDLAKEDWYAYMDNYGTSEEKAFVAFFRDYVEKLRKNYDTIFLVRNERLFHLYSFDDGLRFEPDFVVFLKKNNESHTEQLQIFVEPKGTHLLEKDAWKEAFLLEMKEHAIPVKVFVDDCDYKIWGLHFFNRDERTAEFQNDFAQICHDTPEGTIP